MTSPDAAAPSQGSAVAGRSPWQIAWAKLRADRAALAGGVLILFFMLVAIFAGPITRTFGYPPEEFHPEALDPMLQIAKGPWGGISSEHLLGVEPVNGRDLFSRVVYGARISLLIAFLATLLSIVIGVSMGILAGYVGGWVDSVISRLMDLFLAFPLLLFAMALIGVLPDTAFGLSGDAVRLLTLVFVIGFFAWPYIARIVRGQTLSLREREFIDAARCAGASHAHILWREILPNLVAPILVYATLLIPTNILFEAALSFLGVGVRPPTPTWGGMLADATHWYQIAPVFMIVPGIAIFATVLAFNLLGDGLRDALDPKTR